MRALTRAIFLVLLIAFITGLAFYALTVPGRHCPPEKPVRVEDGSCMPESFFEGTFVPGGGKSADARPADAVPETPEVAADTVPEPQEVAADAVPEVAADDAPVEMTVVEAIVCDPLWPFFGMTGTYPTYYYIRVNECLIYGAGGDAFDVANAWRHERAHAAGWRHYEGTPETNAAYWPTQVLGDGQ